MAQQCETIIMTLWCTSRPSKIKCTVHVTVVQTDKCNIDFQTTDSVSSRCKLICVHESEYDHHNNIMTLYDFVSTNNNYYYYRVDANRMQALILAQVRHTLQWQLCIMGSPRMQIFLR